MRWLVLSGIVAGSVFGRAAKAQLADILPGVRVRVSPSVNTARIDGTIIARSGDSVIVATQKGAQYRLDLGSVRSIDVYRGRSRIEGAKKGAWWGALIAAVPLAIIYVAPHRRAADVTRADELRFSLYLITGVAEDGALIGLFVRGDSWERCRGATAPTCGSRP